jgi:poly(3-hydroxybutyrate) depolymerase
MPTMMSRGSTGGALLLKMAPVGTPLFDAEAPGVGLHGDCVTCRQANPPPQIPPTGVGAKLVEQHLLNQYPNTRTL